jgi:ketosteroid isomerase-like protein
MKRALLFVAALAVTAFVPTIHAQAAPPAEEAAIRAVLDRQAVDWNRGDIEAFATGYKNSPDTLFVGATIRRGYQGMIESYRKNYPSKAAMGTLTFSNVEVHPLDAHFALVLGNFHLERTAEGGGNADGNYSLVMERTPAGWKISVDHTEAAAPKSPSIAAITGTTAAVTGPCKSPDERRFDFWLGNWYVTNAQGGHDGDSTIQSLYNGCVILENWVDATGTAGKSFNTLDRRTKTWSQYWVDSFGHHTQFTNGVWNDPSLVFEGHNLSQKGEPAVQRFTFTRLDADNVRQMQEESLDGGKTWSVTYDLHYTRKPA